MTNATQSPVLTGILAVIEQRPCSLADLAKLVDLEAAMDWLRTAGNQSNDPVLFMDCYWRFHQRLASYVADLDDAYPRECHPIWQGEFHQAARYVLAWTWLASYSGRASPVTASVERNFDKWLTGLRDLPLRWRLAVCCTVETLCAEINSTSTGGFDMPSPVDTVIDSLDEPYRTLFASTGNYGVNELQSMLESLSQPTHHVALPPGDYGTQESYVATDVSPTTMFIR